jgi:hypothetical protein
MPGWEYPSRLLILGYINRVLRREQTKSSMLYKLQIVKQENK